MVGVVAGLGVIDDRIGTTAGDVGEIGYEILHFIDPRLLAGGRHEDGDFEVLKRHSDVVTRTNGTKAAIRHGASIYLDMLIIIENLTPQKSF